MLQCSCNYDPEPGDVMWECVGEVRPLERERATRCADCGDRIAPGDGALKVLRWKVPGSDIERRIYGEDYDHGPPRAPHYLCDQCGALFLGLERVTDGCCWFYRDTRQAVEDYKGMLLSGEFTE